MSGWQLRQFSSIDADGRVVRHLDAAGNELSLSRADRGRTEKADTRVTGWRVRWTAPSGTPRSRSFTKARTSPAVAWDAALELLKRIEAAQLGGWHEASDGSPAPGQPDAPPPT